MKRWISGLAVALITYGAAAEVLWELASPNEELDGWFGVHVSALGDVDSDGCADAIVGACWEDGAGIYGSGRVYVFSGATGDTLYSLVSPDAEASGLFGFPVSNVGDVSGDGVDDVAVGAWAEDGGATDAGRVYVFSGQTGAKLHAFVSPNPEFEGNFSIGLSGAGDVNNDGLADLIIGAYKEDPGDSPSGAGRAYVFSGATGDSLFELASPNEEQTGWFGHAVSAAGDVDDDGYDDVLVGAPMEDGGVQNSGRAYVFSGATGDTLYSLVSPGDLYGARFGWSASVIGDVDADGHDDILVGAPRENVGATEDVGRAYVFSGATGESIHTLVSPNEEEDGYFGISVSAAGDVDGDGYDDVVVGAEQEDPGASPTDGGRAYVFSGASGSLLYQLISPNEEVSGRFGLAASGGCDVNGDGYDDVIVGTRWEDPGASPTNAGRAYVFSWMHLSPSLSGNALELQWSTWPPAVEYWIYGADNLPYFDPGFAPGYEYKLDEVVPPTATWSSTSGVGDPDHNWTYLVIAVDGSENELVRSNHAGEHDFEADIP